MKGREETEIKKNARIKRILEGMPDFVIDWHDSLRNKGMQPGTRLIYVYKIKKFVNDMNIKTVDDITYTTVTRWMNANTYNAEGNETSGSHRQLAWSVMKNFIMYLQEGGLIDNVIKVSLDGKIKVGANERPKGDNQEELKNRRIIIGEEEFNKMLAATDNCPNYVNAIRDKAILSLFMYTGMRETALTEMNLEDIDFEAFKVSYIDKREQYFTRTVSESVVEYLKEWLEVRYVYENKQSKPSSALFLSNRGSRITPLTIALMVKKYSLEALGYEISPHKLRSGFITIMYNHTHDIELVRRIIGHSNLATTQRYIRVKSDELDRTRMDILDSIF